MNETEIRAIVFDEIRRLTPETDPADISPEDDIREALDFDSMDILNLAIALGRRLKVSIPDEDVAKLTTIAGAVAYLAGAA